MSLTALSHWYVNIHYIDVIMRAMASQITSFTIVYSTVYSDQGKHQSSASLASWGEFTGDRWIPHTKGQSRRKCFHLMMSSWLVLSYRIVTYIKEGFLQSFKKCSTVSTCWPGTIMEWAAHQHWPDYLPAVRQWAKSTISVTLVAEHSGSTYLTTRVGCKLYL